MSHACPEEKTQPGASAPRLAHGPGGLSRRRTLLGGSETPAPCKRETPSTHFPEAPAHTCACPCRARSPHTVLFYFQILVSARVYTQSPGLFCALP